MRENGVITDEQYERLINKASITTKDILVTRNVDDQAADVVFEKDVQVEVALNDALLNRSVAENRVRLQWDVSF